MPWYRHSMGVACPYSSAPGYAWCLSQGRGPGNESEIYRGYYMPARGYEFYLRVEHEKIKFISISEYVIFCLYKHQWNTKSACFQRRDLLCNHNDGDLFTCEHNMLSSRVKIWSFRGKAHLVFHWCLYNKLAYYSVACDFENEFTSAFTLTVEFFFTKFSRRRLCPLNRKNSSNEKSIKDNEMPTPIATLSTTLNFLSSLASSLAANQTNRNRY